MEDEQPAGMLLPKNAPSMLGAELGAFEISSIGNEATCGAEAAFHSPKLLLCRNSPEEYWNEEASRQREHSEVRGYFELLLVIFVRTI